MFIIFYPGAKNTKTVFYFNIFSEISGRMEAHAQTFEDLLKRENTNLDTAFDKQKSDAIHRSIK